MQLTTATGSRPCAGVSPSAPVAGRPRRQPSTPRLPCGLGRLFACRKQSSGTSVQDELIHVVIPLRASCCAVLGISFTKTVPAYPPRAGPCGAPRPPPRRGASPLSAQRPSVVFAGSSYLLGEDPQTPRCGLRPQIVL